MMRRVLGGRNTSIIHIGTVNANISLQSQKDQPGPLKLLERFEVLYAGSRVEKHNTIAFNNFARLDQFPQCRQASGTFWSGENTLGRADLCNGGDQFFIRYRNGRPA
jgi:hypothetical protein